MIHLNVFRYIAGEIEDRMSVHIRLLNERISQIVSEYYKNKSIK